MKVGERGQVTIPHDIREKFGIGPATEVEFTIVDGSIHLKKSPAKLDIRKWIGSRRGSLEELGYKSIDEFIDDVRGK